MTSGLVIYYVSDGKSQNFFFFFLLTAETASETVWWDVDPETR